MKKPSIKSQGDKADHILPTRGGRLMKWHGTLPHPVRHIMCNSNYSNDFSHNESHNTQRHSSRQFLQAAAPCGVPFVPSRPRDGTGEIDADAVIGQVAASVGGVAVNVTKVT